MSAIIKRRLLKWWLGIALIASLCGCRTYLVRDSDLASYAAVVPATRETDGARVGLLRGSFQAQPRPATARGLTRVRGAVGARPLWLAAAIVTTIGGVMAAIGGVLFVTQGLQGQDGEYSSNPAQGLAGIVLMGIGCPGEFIAGPGLFLGATIREARQPVELTLRW
jgi:hypothetical protein